VSLVFRCIFYFAITINLTACLQVLSSNTVTPADNYFNKQQYDKAITAYQEQEASDPDNINLKMGLIKALATSAVALYEEAYTLPSEGIDSRIHMLKKANRHREQAKTELAKAISIKPLDPQIIAPFSRPTQLLLPHDDMNYTMQIKLYQETLIKHEAFTTKELNETNVVNDDISLKIDAVLAMISKGKNGPVNAYNAFQPYDKYASHMAKAKKAKAEIEKASINFYEKAGLLAISSNKFQSAANNFNAAEKIDAHSNQVSAGNLSITAKKQINSKKYQAAFDTLNEIENIHAQSTFLKKHHTIIRTKIVNKYLSRAAPKANSPLMSNKAIAFDLYFQAKPVAKADPKLSQKVEKAIQTLQNKVSLELTKNALSLNKLNPYAYSAVTTNLLTTAYSFSDKGFADYKKTALRANATIPHMSDFYITFATTGDAPNTQQDFTDWLEEKVHSGIQKKSITSVKPVKLSKLNIAKGDLNSSNIFNDTVIAYEDSELVFLLDLTEHNIKESGRKRASYLASQYVSSSKKITNPDYEKNKQALIAASTVLAEKKQLENSAFKLCSDMKIQNNLAIECTYGSFELENANNAFVNAEMKFKATPKEIEENITTDYKYEEYSIKVSGSIQATLTAYDRRSRNTFPLKPIKVSVDKAGYLRKKVKEQDANGYKNGETNIPDLGEETFELEQQLLQHVINEITVFTEPHQWKRFCLQGDALSAKSLPSAATEAYMQCIALAKEKAGTSNEIAKANKAVNNYIGFTEQMISKYGRNVSSEQFLQQNYSLSTKEKTSAKQAASTNYASRIPKR